MLAAYNAIANDGVYVAPKLVLETVAADGSRHPSAASEGRRVVSEDTAAKLRTMLANVVSEGTGSRGGITGYTVAGKTGTARKPINGGYEDANGQYHYVATFAGFVPAERPELSIIVVIDEPTGDIFGGSVAAPVFADLAQYGLRLFRIPPPIVEHAPAPDTAAARANPASSHLHGAGGQGSGQGHHRPHHPCRHFEHHPHHRAARHRVIDADRRAARHPRRR